MIVTKEHLSSAAGVDVSSPRRTDGASTLFLPSPCLGSHVRDLRHGLRKRNLEASPHSAEAEIYYCYYVFWGVATSSFMASAAPSRTNPTVHA
ncbi:hypothetical protein MKX08_006646 [Trichoderma sp. CBMAI-0020]|nr:hypothetical protein MKX08_006646 [Trichoderma sp. CBMAI-0020]